MRLCDLFPCYYTFCFFFFAPGMDAFCPLPHLRRQVAESFPYNEKVDVYSYGLVLWTMCTLKKPFETMGRDEFYQKVVRAGTRPPINKKWPRMLSDIMRVSRVSRVLRDGIDGFGIED